MRKSSLKVTFDEFFYWMKWYIEFLEKTINAERVVRTEDEKEGLVEAFVFKIHTNWEILVEELITDCLNRDTSQYAQYKDLRLPKHLSRDVCQAMVEGLGYFDCRSMSEVKKIAKNILVSQYNPFQNISKSDADKIDEFCKIRNHLAHYSAVSKRSLLNVYHTHRLQNFRQPGGFLLSIDRRTNRIRLDSYIKAFINAAKGIAKFLGVGV